jgi:hypothetical protein
MTGDVGGKQLLEASGPLGAMLIVTSNKYGSGKDVDVDVDVISF